MDNPKILDINSPHMALLFLIDNSSFMKGNAIEELNLTMNKFIKQIKNDSFLSRILDISIVTYNYDFSVIQEFLPVENMKDINFTTGDLPYISKALSFSIDTVIERTRLYRILGTEPYKPWIVIITNGMPMDEPEDLEFILSKSKELIDNKKIRIWTLLAGNNLEDNTSSLWLYHSICKDRVLNLKNLDFTSFFDWTCKSMAAVSQSSPSERIKPPVLPKNIELDNKKIQDTALVLAKCSTTKNYFGIRLFKDKNNKWQPHNTFPVRKIPNNKSTYYKTITLSNWNSDIYKGCPYCFKKAITLCFCGNPYCDNFATNSGYKSTCPWCNTESTIERIDVIKVKTSNDFDR